MTTRTTSSVRVPALLLLGIETATAALVGLGLLGRARAHPHQGFALAGLLILALGGALAVVAAAGASGRSWARRVSLCLQALFGAVCLATLAARPTASVVGLALAAATGVALLVPEADDRRRRGVAPPLPSPSPLTTAWPTPVSSTTPAPPVPFSTSAAGGPAVAVINRPDEPAGEQLTAGGLLIGSITALIVLGALAIRGDLIIGLVLLAVIFVPLERVFTLHPQRVFRAGWRTDVVHFTVNNILTTALLVIPVVGLGVLARAAVPSAAREAIADQPAGAQAIEVLLIAGVAGYWAHRMTHTVPVLWRFHKVHHSIQQMDWLAAARLHPIDSVFTRTITVLPIFALGFTRAALGGFLAFTTFQAIFIHANVRLTFGPLRWLVATPEFHHWHHANEPDAYNTNFAGEFPWLDALFGTLYLPKGRMPARYGIDDQVPDGYLRQLAWPLRAAVTPATPTTAIAASAPPRNT
jgi:sterol desaturase/sphingolipid hydroxylase (fatty acid hydroxylase superfamily)